MTKEEYNDLSNAIDRIIKHTANDDNIPRQAALCVVGAMAGFKMFFDEYYENHKTIA